MWTIFSVLEIRSSTSTSSLQYKRTSKFDLKIPRMYCLWDSVSAGRQKVQIPASKLTQYKSVLGQIKWLQSRTQYQACYRFTRCASASASPTIADVRALNKLARSIRAEPCVLRYWPLKGSLRLVGYPDATCRRNADNNSQRGQAIVLWFTSSHTRYIE